MSRTMFCACLAFAAALTAAGAVLQGKYSNRWAASSLLAAAGAQLQAVPENVGPWRMQQSQPFSASTVDMLQCAGYIHRTYVHRKTGMCVNVAVLAGPFGPTSAHIPEICYSSRAYDIEGASARFEVPRQGATPDEFWGVTFRSLNPGAGLLQVGYAWSIGGPWVAPDHPRLSFGGSPLLYKLQVAITLPTGADVRKYDACREFLRDFLPALQSTLLTPASQPGRVDEVAATRPPPRKTAQKPASK